jgi:hypothetical protein
VGDEIEEEFFLVHFWSDWRKILVRVMMQESVCWIFGGTMASASQWRHLQRGRKDAWVWWW